MGDNDKPATQADVDKYFKLWKETGEKLEVVVGKLDKTAAEKVELVGQVKDMDDRIKKMEVEKKPPAYAPPIGGDEDLTKVFTLENPPQSKEAWNDLYDADPDYAHDLKIEVRKVGEKRHTAIQTAAKTVQDKHPDMYKVDAEGKIKRFRTDPNQRDGYAKDNTGVPIEDTAGVPMFDQESEKGKIWMGLATDPNFLKAPNAPIIIMEAMENKIRTKKEKDMADKLKKEKEDKEVKRVSKVDAAALAAGGDNPPVETDDIKVEYSSEEEKKHVHAAIAAGRYNDEKDYFKRTRRGTEISYGRGGF